MKVAIFETTHFEVTYTLISLFDTPKNDLTIFIYADAHQQLLFLLGSKANRYKWIVKKPQHSNREFIKAIFHYTRHNNFDLLYFNTIAHNFILYAFYLKNLQHIPSVLTLHDINSHFQFKPSLNFKRLMRYIGKKILIRRFQNFNVLANTMIPYLRKNLPPQKKILNIPGGLFLPGNETLLQFKTGSQIKIVIPGSIDERRRDYSIVKELLDNAKRENIDIEICLLGAFTPPHCENIYEYSKNYLTHSSNLRIFYGEIVNQQEYDITIQQSHFVLMPIRPKVSIHDGIIEEYGKTICTGNIGDVIRHAKPFFVPKKIPLEANLYDSALTYKSTTDILEVIKQLTPDAYDKMQQRSLKSSHHYTRENIISRYPEYFY